MTLLRQFLSTAGDGTGTVNGATDASSVAVHLKLVPPAGQEYRVSGLIFFIEDGSALVGDAFAGATMTNGIRVQVLNGSDVSVLDVDCGQPIKRLADFISLHAHGEFDSAGTNKFAAYHMDFEDTPIVLNGSTPTRLDVKLNDNLSTAVRLTILAVGIKRGQPVA